MAPCVVKNTSCLPDKRLSISKPTPEDSCFCPRPKYLRVLTIRRCLKLMSKSPETSCPPIYCCIKHRLKHATSAWAQRRYQIGRPRSIACYPDRETPLLEIVRLQSGLTMPWACRLSGKQRAQLVKKKLGQLCSYSI